MDRELGGQGREWPVSCWRKMEMKKGEKPTRPRELEDECVDLGVMEHEMSELEIGSNKR